MEREQLLPRFGKPPLIEVVHGIQFRPLAFSVQHPGMFFALLRDRYPTTQTMPPLAPIKETFDGQPGSMQFRFDLTGSPELPRAWFVGTDDALLVQLQTDRLILNWRRGARGNEYPHFEEVSAEFHRVFESLRGLVADERLGEIECEQCELTYINHIMPQDGEAIDPADFFRGWAGMKDWVWTAPVEDVSLAIRFLMKDESDRAYGRLHTTFSGLVEHKTGRRGFQYELTARGAPYEGGLAGILGFHASAHKYITRTFAASTTATAHQLWERSQ